MKKLQNNFTTQEQSERLLELGVPADSANCYFFRDGNKYDGVPRPFFLFSRTYEYAQDFNAAYGDKIFPCWSVGRLIEIIGICAGMECVDFETLAWTQGEWSEKLIRIIKDLVRYNKMDFSELEE